tara:strand:- start:388 stop:615 length:228 start_codon:yes stop_codon:yes gene_type:complete
LILALFLALVLNLLHLMRVLDLLHLSQALVHALFQLAQHLPAKALHNILSTATWALKATQFPMDALHSIRIAGLA